MQKSQKNSVHRLWLTVEFVRRVFPYWLNDIEQWFRVCFSWIAQLRQLMQLIGSIFIVHQRSWILFFIFGRNKLVSSSLLPRINFSINSTKDRTAKSPFGLRLLLRQRNLLLKSFEKRVYGSKGYNEFHILFFRHLFFVSFSSNSHSFPYLLWILYLAEKRMSAVWLYI